MKIGIISDTHNLLRPEVLEHLGDSDVILHAGDISSQGILDELRRTAPVYVVRGNNEKGQTEELPCFLDFELAGLRIYMTHKKKDLPDDLRDYDLVVIGHSHQYADRWMPAFDKRRTLILNPGSCGPRRFHQPITMAVMTVDGDGFNVRRIDIPHSAKEKAPETSADVHHLIEVVIRETQKGRSPTEIAERYGMDTALAEQIARLYVTHPGVTVDGIMAKMGL